MTAILRKSLRKLYEVAECESTSDGNSIDRRRIETTPFRPSFSYHPPKNRVTDEFLEFIGGWKRLKRDRYEARVDKTGLVQVCPSDTLVEDKPEIIWFIPQTTFKQHLSIFYPHFALSSDVILIIIC